MSELLDPRTIIATWHLGPFAEVRVGEHVTRYVRRGTGSCVLVLFGEIEGNSLWEPLVESLAVGHKVVIPQRSDNGEHSVFCLRGFIEGIGASEIVLIAGGSAVTTARELALADDFTVRKLVLVGDCPPEPAASSDRVLWISPAQPAATSVQRIAEFLAAP